MRVWDITMPLWPGMPVYPGDPAVELTPVARLEAGDVAAVARFCLGTHTGTHVDPPSHFIAGAATVDELPLEALVGLAEVVDCRLPATAGATQAGANEREIGVAALAAVVPERARRLLIRTGGGELWDAPGFPVDFPGLTLEAARWLAARGMLLVGIDRYSIAPFDDPLPAYEALLRAGVVVVVGLDLRAVAPGRYRLACLPLRLRGGDGAPARAVLWREDGDDG